MARVEVSPSSGSLREDPLVSAMKDASGEVGDEASPPGSLWCFFLWGLPSTDRYCWASVGEWRTLKDIQVKYVSATNMGIKEMVKELMYL